MQFAERTALVTGGSGFIGQPLVGRLLSAGWTIHNLDFVPGHIVHPKLIHWPGSFLDSGLLHEAMVGVDTVWHLASTHFPREADQEPRADVEGAVLGTLLIAETAQLLGARRVIYASSGGTVYGRLTSVPVSEDHPTRPITAYGISKLACEHYLRFFDRRGLSTLSLRIANPYGPGQNIAKAQGALTTFCHQAATGQPITIWGDGTVERDFVHVDDVARALVLAADADIRGTEINIGSGQGASLNRLLDLIREVHEGEPLDVTYQAARSFDVPRSVLCIKRARELLGWRPQVALSDGIAQMMDAFAALHSPPPDHTVQPRRDSAIAAPITPAESLSQKRRNR